MVYLLRSPRSGPRTAISSHRRRTKPDRAGTQTSTPSRAGSRRGDRVNSIAERVSTMEEKHIRKVVAGLAALMALVGVRTGLVAQDSSGGGSGRALVLVAPLKTSGGVDHNFGKDVAKKVREQLNQFDILAPVKDDQVKKTLDQFKLDEDQMDLISWRQLAGRLNAGLIIFGTAQPAGSDSTKVDAAFVDPKRGEETKVPEFTVRNGDKDQASQRIITALGNTVKFLRALANCNDYLSGNQFEDAARNCDAALQINPESSRAKYLRGRVAMKQEKWDEAQKYLQPVVKAEPSNEDALQSLAYTEAQLGNQQEALKLYQQYLQFNPDNPQIRLSVAYNLASAGAYGQAEKLIQAGIERDSTNAALWKYLGDVSMKAGTTSDSSQVNASSAITDTASIQTAIDAYHHYLKLQPDSASASIYRNIVAADLQLGNVQTADQESLNAIHQFPQGDAGLWSLRADVLAHEDDLKGAVLAMDSALAADSTLANAFFKRGLYKLRSGDQQGAIADFHTAVNRNNQNPNNIATALYGTGFQDYFKKNRFQEAADMFTAAVNFTNDPSLTNQLNFWIGYSYYKAGETLDQSNQKAEACQPARNALSLFQKVAPYIKKAGDYQTPSQKQILDGTDTYLYRQNQLVKKACKRQ